jgi:hypothetical protein
MNSSLPRWPPPGSYSLQALSALSHTWGIRSIKTSLPGTPHKCCGSRSSSGLDPDPRRAKMIHKNRKKVKIPFLEVLDVLF